MPEPTFLLIHGSCHGAWCWDALIAELAALGRQARAIDLPSHGADATPAHEVTLALYARAIVAAMDAPVVLVGHSMAGYPITAAADLAPERIARLVYLCAYAPMPGLSLAQMRRLATTQPLIDAITVASDRATFRFDPAKAVDRLYHDVAPAIAAAAVARLGAQPIAPQETPWQPGPSVTLPRSYIRCTDDRAIPPDFQETMTAGWPAECVHTLPTSHSPFLSAPKALALLLCQIADA
ncbi:MAG: alpha/beta fold hydrolase [Rhodobacterales bacterium]|nr:alpha/beta fold hydrolase [Rhodobacterales bacterium]